MNYMMKADGSFYRILIAPVRRSSIVLGQLLEAVLCTFLEVFIMAAISLLFFRRIFCWYWSISTGHPAGVFGSFLYTGMA